MIKSYEEKHYKSAHSRLAVNMLERFLQDNVPQVGGKEIRLLLAEKIISEMDEYMPDIQRVKPGQMHH